MTRLTVEKVHRLSSRPWVFVTGRLEGDDLVIGDRLTVVGDGTAPATAVIRSIELHTGPGRTTIAVDADLADRLRDGVVLVRDRA